MWARGAPLTADVRCTPVLYFYTTMNNASTARRRLKIAVLCVIVAMVAIAYVLVRNSSTVAPGDKNSSNGQNSERSKTASSFNKSAHSLTNPASIWVIVNKQHPLKPKNYAPTLIVPSVPLKGSASAGNMHVSTTMAPALEKLFAGAKAAGYTLMLSSGYRSYSYQVGVYNGIVASQGQVAADEQSARPGYSEHQTGLAADVAPSSGTCDLSQCFGTTPQGGWLAANAYKYGFIIRYPADKQSVTGYEYEPWHIRYIGTDLSMQMHNQGIETLEEFFGVSGGASYN